ncbi:MAG: ABC transporter substrate-binding protein [Idiomarina sp.]|nr:ABC transporter substrate-binding protein [Idiomarina sp.]
MTTSNGYEVELLQAIIARMGATAELTHVPNRRLASLISASNFDIATLQPFDANDNSLYYSCPYIRYENVAVVRADRDLHLDNLSDLADLRVQAFQTAERVLGETYRAMIGRMAEYSETVNQSTQVQMLLLDRVDSIVLDKNILHFHYSQLLDPPPLRSIPISHVLYRAAFKDPSLAEDFDRAQQEFWKSEEFIALQETYFGEVNQALEAYCHD